MEQNTTTLIQDAKTNGMSYGTYRDLVDQMAAEGKSTGPNQTEALTNYGIKK